MQSEIIMHRIIKMIHLNYKLLYSIVVTSSSGSTAEKGKGCKKLVTCHGQGFGEEIGVIADAGDEHGVEVTLSNPIPDPMPAHVNRL